MRDVLQSRVAVGAGTVRKKYDGQNDENSEVFKKFEEGKGEERHLMRMQAMDTCCRQLHARVVHSICHLHLRFGLPSIP